MIKISNNKVEKIETKNNVTLLNDSKGDVCGININDYNKYIDGTPGAHTLSKEQKEYLKSIGVKSDMGSHFIIGKILKIDGHPKTDKLSLLTVITDKEIKIITNLKTLKESQNIIIAKPGATLPNGDEISHSKVMGIFSEGMICTDQTLGPSATHEKVSKLKVGNSFTF